MNLFLLQGPGSGEYFREMSNVFWISLTLTMNLIVGVNTFGSSPTPVASTPKWSEVKSLYEKSKWTEALTLLEENPKDRSSYYYDLGTIYYHQDNPILAVAYLEKASRLQPHDPDIQNNLALARKALESTVDNVEKLDPASTELEQLGSSISAEEIRAVLGLISMIGVLFLIHAYLKTRNAQKALKQPAALLGILCFVLVFGVFALYNWATAYPPAICLNKEAIRSGPGSHYLELSQTVPGAKVRLLGPSITIESVQSGKSPEIWKQIRFSANGIGWVKSSYLLEI